MVGVHALRNSLITVTTVIGLQLGALISGAVITEQIFGIAGFGRLTVDAVNQRDYALLQGVVLVAAAGYVIVNFARRRRLLAAQPAHPRQRQGGMTVTGAGEARAGPATASRRGRAAGGCSRSGSCAGRSPSPGSWSRSRSCSKAIFAPILVAALQPERDRLRRDPREAVLGSPARHGRARPRHPLARSSSAPARRSWRASSRRCWPWWSPCRSA